MKITKFKIFSTCFAGNKKGKRVKEKRVIVLKASENTKAVVAVPGIRIVDEAVGNTTVNIDVEPRAATNHAGSSFFCAHRVYANTIR